MTSFTITVEDAEVRSALQALAARVSNIQPVMQSIGEGIVERTKHRFDTSTGPDGVPWKPNSPATLAMLAAGLGKSYRRKGGGLNKRGESRVAGKKPLIGDSGDLRRQIVAIADARSTTVTASPVYAAIQQFGGRAGRGHKVTIPARPYLPILPDGSLYHQEQAWIVKTITAYLVGGS